MPDEFVRVMFGAAELLGRPITAERVAAYWAMLGHYGLEALTSAIRQSVFESDWIPSPARLIGILEGESGDPEAEATAVWAAVRGAITAGGSLDAFGWDARVAAGLAAAGGAYAIRTGCDGESEVWKQRKFVKAFIGTTMVRRRQLAQGTPTPIGDLMAQVFPASKLLEDGKKAED